MIVHSNKIIPTSNNITLALTIKDIFELNINSPAKITTKKSEYVYRQLAKCDNILKARQSYEICFNEYVEIPENICGIVYPTKNAIIRGIYNTSGLYDTGFSGYVGTTIHNQNFFDIEVSNELVCEMVFFKSSSLYSYNGSYSHNTDSHWTKKLNLQIGE